MQPALEIRGYGLDYATPRGVFHALRNIDLAINAGEALGLVGESGSGKTSLAWAIMRYLPRNASELGGSIRLAGDELRTTTTAEILAIRGRRIGMVFQDPSTSLNPTLTLGEQLGEVLVRHRGLTRRQAQAEGVALLDRVGLKQPAEMMRRYPHQASGGEKQRVVIATAFACQPDCILFDEPTTALDVITAARILELFAGLQAETGVASLYISHDLALVSRIANRVAVIHQGEIVEQGEVGTIFRMPQDAYTRRLIAAVPRPDHRLTITEPPAAKPLLEVNRLGVQYGKPSFLGRLFGRGQASVRGIGGVSFTLRPGEILGIVGESGSGKSTLARALAGLTPFTGELLFAGRHVTTIREMDRGWRRDMQIIFQHPDSSLNPRQRIGEILARPLKLYRLAARADIPAEIARLLAQVRLPAEFARRYPHQLSGGEKQRVAIARAFAAQPKLIICDEITSALDVSVQAAVVRLLIELQPRTGTACLFVTHDLNLVRQIAHRIAVMYRGDLVDLFDAGDFAAADRHDYTRALLQAVPPPVGLVAENIEEAGDRN